MELSQKLKMLRKEKGLSQLELSEKLHVSRQAVSGWEVGDTRPSTENLQGLSKLYEVPLEYLLNDNLEQTNQTERPEDKLEERQENLLWKNLKPKKYIIMMVLVILMTEAVLTYRGMIRKDAEDIIEFSEMESKVLDRTEGVSMFSLTWD